MKKLIVLFFLFSFILPRAYAKDEARDITNGAFNDVKVATELVNQANSMIQDGELARQKAEVALSLYVRAGQLFEKAEALFKAVGFDYVSQRDIDGAKEAKESCILNIEELKKRLPNLKM